MPGCATLLLAHDMKHLLLAGNGKDFPATVTRKVHCDTPDLPYTDYQNQGNQQCRRPTDYRTRTRFHHLLVQQQNTEK